MRDPSLERGRPPASHASASGSAVAAPDRDSRPHRREKNHVANRRLIGEQHHQAVDTHPDATGRRHAVLERPDVIGVKLLRFVVAGVALRALILEPRALIIGIVELAERVGELGAIDEQLEPFGEPRIATVRFRERRERARIVDHEGRLHQRRLERVLNTSSSSRPPAMRAHNVAPIRRARRQNARMSSSVASSTSTPQASRMPSTNATCRYGGVKSSGTPRRSCCSAAQALSHDAADQLLHHARACRCSRRTPGTIRAS